MGVTRSVPQKRSAPRAAKTKAATRLNEDSYWSDEDLAEAVDVDVDVDNVDSQTLDLMQLQKRVEDLKTKKTTKNYTAKFSQIMKADEEKAIAALEEQKHRMESESTVFKDKFVTLVEDGLISSGSKEYSEISDRSRECPLRDFQDSVYTLAEEVFTAPILIQNTVTSVLSDDLVIGHTWEQDGDEALAILRQCHEATQQSLERWLRQEEEVTVSTPWNKAVKDSSVGIRKILKKAPVPYSDEEA